MKKEYDFSKMKRRPGKPRVVSGASKIPISIRLDAKVMVDLQNEAFRLGIPYQTFISSILHRYINQELVDPKSIDITQLRGLLTKERSHAEKGMPDNKGTSPNKK
jgi:uncharacterized protein (DUF4415 family)